MTEQIEIIERALKKVKDQKENFGFMDRFLVDENLVVAEALEKQIPKKPKIVEADMEGMDMETGEEYTYKIDEAHCSHCDCIVGADFERYSYFCHNCGQKIDWSIWVEED